MMQAFSFRSGYSTPSESHESATEMHTLENRRQRRNGRHPNSAQSDDTDDNMEDAPVTSASTEFGLMSPLQRKHKIRSFEKLDVEGFNEVGYLSDSSLPSVRQSIARQQEREITESTPLLSNQHSLRGSLADLERTEQLLDDDDDDDNQGDVTVQTPKIQRKQAIKKYGKQIKIAVLFVILLASVVRHFRIVLNKLYSIYCPSL